MELQIVNPDPRYAPAALLEPATSGYIHIGAEVRPPPRPGPLLFRGRAKRHLLATLDELARRLERERAVEKVTVYEAVAIPPFSRFPYVKDRAGEIRFPRFDVVVLVETTSPAALRDVQATAPYRELLDTLRAHARRVHVVAARNAKRMGDVDKTRQGLFLFNYFVADDAERALRLWDHLAAWYQVETGLDNSTLLVPLEGERSGAAAPQEELPDVRAGEPGGEPRGGHAGAVPACAAGASRGATSAAGGRRDGGRPRRGRDRDGASPREEAPQLTARRHERSLSQSQARDRSGSPRGSLRSRRRAQLQAPWGRCQHARRDLCRPGERLEPCLAGLQSGVARRSIRRAQRRHRGSLAEETHARRAGHVA